MHRLTPLALVLAALLVCAVALSGCGGGGSFSTGTVTDTSFSNSSDRAPAADAAPVPAPAPARSAAVSRGTGNGDEEIPVIVTFKKAPGTEEADRIRRAGGRVKYGYSLIPAAIATMTRRQMASLEQDSTVAYVEPDATVHALADTVNWNVTKLNASKVWTGGNMGAGVRVAVMDTGIDYNHPDLKPNYKGGYNFVAKNTNPLDDHGHGTHVAGIIAAAADGAGVEGVAPKASLYALKVLDKSGSGTYSNMIAALQWAVTNHMQIVSMSLGAPTNSKALHDACTAAYKAGVLLVAAAGNSGTASGLDTTIEYPAAFGAVMAVGAVDASNVRPYWSSTGPKLEIAAPGVNISSDRLGGGVVSMSGTSMACPHISGVAALILGSGVTSQVTVRQRLVSGATDLGVTGRDSLYGYGLANASKSVTAAALAALATPYVFPQ